MAIETPVHRPLSRLRRVLVSAKPGAPTAPRIAEEIASWLGGRRVQVDFETSTAAALGRSGGIGRDRLPDDLDLVIVAGGDGSLLSAARIVAQRGTPILGVNLGSLGFLTELQPDELFGGLEAVLAGRYSIEERQALRVRHLHAGVEQQEYTVLNDAVITKSALARMINIDVSVDGDAVASYTSDGLIVSTPTGSTAYSLSAGGPILDPRMSAFVVAPICPHTMTYRPLVVPGSVVVSLTLRSSGEAVYLTLDGQIGFPLETDDSVEIRRNPVPVRLVRVTGRTFFQVLRRKLRWGER